MTQIDKMERGMVSCCPVLLNILIFFKLRSHFLFVVQLRLPTFRLHSLSHFAPRRTSDMYLEVNCVPNSLSAIENNIDFPSSVYTALNVIWNGHTKLLERRKLITIIPITLYPPLGCQDTLMKLDEEVVNTLLLTSPVNLTFINSYFWAAFKKWWKMHTWQVHFLQCSFPSTPAYHSRSWPRGTGPIKDTDLHYTIHELLLGSLISIWIAHLNGNPPSSINREQEVAGNVWSHGESGRVYLKDFVIDSLNIFISRTTS